jgi:hypothetical protein
MQIGPFGVWTSYRAIGEQNAGDAFPGIELSAERSAVIRDDSQTSCW